MDSSAFCTDIPDGQCIINCFFRKDSSAWMDRFCTFTQYERSQSDILCDNDVSFLTRTKNRIVSRIAAFLNSDNPRYRRKLTDDCNQKTRQQALVYLPPQFQWCFLQNRNLHLLKFAWVVYLLYNVFIYSIVKKVINKKFRTEKRDSRSCPFVNYIDFLSLISAIFASFKREAPRTLEKDRYPFIRSIFVTFLDRFGHTSMSSCSYPQSSQ